MQMLRFKTLWSGVLAGLLGFAVSVSAGEAPVRVGDVPPADLGRDSRGRKIDLNEHRGKVVIVTFWASWCGPCMKELPVLENAQRAAGSDRLTVVAINFKEDRERFKQMMRQTRDLQLTFGHDPRGTLSQAFGVKGIPHMLMIDRDGTVAHIHIGYNESQLPRLVDELNALLASPPQTAAPESSGGL